MLGTKRAIVLPLVAAFAVGLTACAHQETKYDQYKDYATNGQYKDVTVLRKASVDQVAAMLCAADYTEVQSALDLLTAPLANGASTEGVGIVEAGLIAKAYCDNAPEAALNLTRAVAAKFGSNMVYAIPN